MDLRTPLSSVPLRKNQDSSVITLSSFFRVPLTVFIIVSVLAITSQAESNLSSIRKLDTLYVLPSEVQSIGWKNSDRALSQDVDEGAVYQNFTTSNSAYLGDNIPKDTPASRTDESKPEVNVEPEQSTGEAPPTEPTDSTNSSPNGETSEPEPSTEENTEIEPTNPESPSPDNESSEPETSSEEPNEETPEPESAEPSPSSGENETPLEALSRSFFRFTNISTAVLPFVQESIIESLPAPEENTIEEPEVTETEEEPEVSSGDEDVPVTEAPEEEGEASPSDEVAEPVEPEVPETVEPEASLIESEGGLQTETEDETVAGNEMIFSDFALPALEPGQLLRNVQFRLSLAGQATAPEGDPLPTIEVEYSLGGEWINAGSVLVESEISNALNGGYFLFALPRFMNIKELDDLSIRVSYRGGENAEEAIFLDSAWLQIDTETFDRELLKERLAPRELKHLALPTMYEFLSADIDFTRDELPTFSLRYESQRNAAVRVIRNIFGRDLAEIDDIALRHISGAPVAVEPDVNVTAEGLITIQLTPEDVEGLQPGTYALEIVVDEGGKTFTDSFEFQWGLIAVNADQTEYKLGDEATIMLGAVSESGNTLCGADLHVYVIDPLQYVSEVPVLPSALCNGNNFIDVPDYTATVTPTSVGTYEVYVERLGAGGEVLAHTNDTFKVVESKELVLHRDGPTRINPKYSYPMTLTVTANGNFEGEVVERIPADFRIVSPEGQLTEVDGIQELRFSLSLGAGETRSFTYEFDAPDISPFLYTLGPADIVDETNAVVIRESLTSSEARFVNEVILAQAEDVTPPAEPQIEEIPASEPVSETEPVPEPVVSEGVSETNGEENLEVTEDESAGVDEVEVIEAEPVLEDEAEAAPEDVVEIEPVSPVELPATTTEEVITLPEETVEEPIDTGVAFSEHRRWQIASDATGSMIVFWASGGSIPAGWTCISCTSTSTFYQRFPVGGSTYGTTGGSMTHDHTADGTVNGSATANAENNAGTFVSRDSHSHTITPIIGSTSTLPAYRSFRVIQNNSAGDPGTIPAGAILMFDGTLPSGWAQYTALDDRYPFGHNTITASSSNSHSHTATGTTAAASGSTVDSRTGGSQVTSAASTHTHTISSTTPTTSLEPPHITVIFATSTVSTSTPLNALALWSDTPPAGWLDRSSTSDKPFYNRYIKGASTYGTVGGAETHTHSNMTITSSAAIGTDNARTGAQGSSNTHTHAVDVTNFSTASNTPPYVTAIFGKFYGYIPIYDQAVYRWFVNTNAQTPTDIWPVGSEAVEENEAIDSTLTPVKNGDVIRLRMGLDVSNSTTTGEDFKLQYGTTTDVCTAVGSWTDVGSATSSAAWIGYNNAAVSDGVTLSSSTLTGTDRFESYEEFNPTVTLPNAIGLGERGEWDFVLRQNAAEAGTNYCFRMVEGDGTELFSYSQYPQLVTNEAPLSPALEKLFDNEKVASTTPWFEFTGTDPEANEMSYQVQIDDDQAFGSVNIDNNTVSNEDQFVNLVTPADKDPFANGETLRFTPPSPLTNGVTYYWRVRAQDPTGSNAWGEWSEVYSFTIDTTVTVSTWFQTTQEQFDSDTLVGTDALITDTVELATGSTTGTTTSTDIDFLDGSTGNAWGSLSWSDTETAGDIKYRVQYFDESLADWAFVPEADLSGNAAGFDTSPISLLTLDVETYRFIRLVGVFTNSGGTPTLSDWTVAWGYRIDTPTNNAPFPSEKVGTTTPTFEFFTTDPQGDSLVYEIQWSTSYAFTASTTRASDINPTGFANITNGGDSDPFNSGDTIQYTVQTGDALTNNTTYWWRVRARDPLGGNEYSFYTDPQSFTVDTSVTVSTWFQTTAEQFDTDILSGAVTQAANTVTVATTSDETLVAYAEGTNSTPKYREWNGTTWSTESDALSVGAAMNWVVTKAHPSENEYVLGTLGTDADVNVQVYTNGAWGDLQEVTTSISNTAMRGFDIAYEQLSGDAIVVYCDGDANPSYYVWNGSTWSSGGAIGITGGNTCGWIKLISDPVSDEIIAVTRDTDGITYEARVWTGSAWGNSATWGSMQTGQATHEGIAAAYEESGNQAVVVVSNGTASSFSWRAWDGANWSAAATQSLGDDFEVGAIAADDGSDNMALCYMDQDGDIGAVRWTGAAWAGQTELETAWTNLTAQFGDRPFDCIYEVGGANDGNFMVVYTDTTNLRYRFWNGAVWSAEASASTLQDGPRVQLARAGDNLIQALSHDHTNDRYDYTYWNGSVWSTLQTLETDAAVGATPYKEAFMMAAKNPAVTGAVVGDPGIDFYAGSGPYWQQMSWNDTEGGGSTILYQVEYYDGDSWELVPNSLIPGNSTGTTTSPINLANTLPVSTYNMLRPVANMSCNLGTCPTLSDWTITWSSGITISGTADQFDQTTDVTSGTVGVALNGVVQTGKTGVIAGGVWSIANVNVAPGDIVTVFVSGANETNEAVAVTRYDGVGDMSGLILYEQHLTLGSDDATTTPFTNAQIGSYDFTQDEDLFFDVSSTTLDMCAESGCANSELYIRASTTYTPSGTTNLTGIENNGTFNLGGNAIYVSRSWDNNGTTTSETSTVVFTATSTSESIDETGAISPSFYNLTFGTTTGTGTWTLVTPIDVNNDLSVTRGTLARGSQLITIGGSLATGVNGLWTGVGTTTFDGSGSDSWSDASAALQNIGHMVIDGTSKTILLGSNVKAQSIHIGADDILDASSSNFDITLYADWINNNTFVARSGEVIMAATTTNRTITAGGDAFYDLTFNGAGGSWSFSEALLSVGNDFRVSTGTVTMPTGTTTVAGSLNSVGGTFAHNNGTFTFTSAAAETIAASGTPFTNNFYNLTFNGAGSWSFLDTTATTSNDFRIQQGVVTLPGAMLSVGGNFANTAGTFAHNSGTVAFTASGARTIDTNSSFNSLLFSGSGSWSFVDASVTALGSLTTTGGTLTLPSTQLTLGGSLANTATINANSGTVLFNSTDGGETIALGSSPLHNMTFNSTTGGWTITATATTTNNFTLSNSSSFTLGSGQALSVGGMFTNAVGGASTTWTGSTLSLETGSYSINAKTNLGDTYETLRIKPNTDIQAWNSSADSYDVDVTSSLYSQDHAGVDGDLYIFGNYVRSSGNEYWSYATDFDGTALTGTTSRQVDVRFSSFASASITGGLFEVIGVSGATTTIANQGSDRYFVSVNTATTTFSYYDFDDLNTIGVELRGDGVVTSLSDGRFVPSFAAGAGLSVSSSTIDANPGLQIYRVEFTAGVPSTFNVTQSDGAPSSYWWFRESSGDLDGEAYDNDTGDPGSIRWDDSSLTITVSGVVYSDDGVTPMGGPVCDNVTQSIRIMVYGGASYTGSCDGSDGSYSIGGVVIVGDPILTVYLDTNGGAKGTVITKTPTADITDLDIYQNRVITRHEDASPLTILNMAVYDGDNDTDIPFTAATGTLSIMHGTELHIASSTTFTADGNITVSANASGTPQDGSLHIDDNATFVGTATSTYTLGGSFTMDAGATFTAASSTVIMNATTTGKTITTPDGQEIVFNILTFTGVGGGWNINGDIEAGEHIEIASGTVSGTGDIHVVNGSLYGDGLLSMGSGTTTIENTNTLGGTTPWTFANLVLGNGAVTGTTTPATNATTTILGKLTISTGHFLDAESSIWNLAGTGNVFVESGTFLEDMSTVRYGGTAAANILSTTYYNLELKALGNSPTYTGTGLGIIVSNDLTVGGATTTAVTFDAGDPALDVNGDVLIENTGTFIGSGSAVTTIAGDWDNNGTFTSSNGTITFDGSGASNIAAGASSFSNVSVNGTGSFTVSEHATATSAFTIQNAGSFTVGSGQTLAIGGTFTNSLGGAGTTWTGSTLYLYGGGNYTINASTTADSYETLRIGSGTQIRMWNSNAAAYDVHAAGSLYSQDHSNVAGDLYIYSAYTKTSGTDHWSYETDFDGTTLGSPRTADVYIANGGSVLYTGGGLSVLGTSTASTIIQNQGSGTYSFRIGGSASTTWSYYEIHDTDSAGLTFSGTPNVTTLSFGDFEVSQNSASAITVGGTVINQNQARTFTNNTFATSSGVSPAFNVTATGTSVSSWRFTNHVGSIDGEAYDSDPNGDPGYVVWDDSAALITVSGNVYSDEGTATSTVCDGSTQNIHLRVAGLTSYTTDCDGTTGAYSISNVAYSVGDSLIVYIDGEAEKAATVSEDPISNISDMDLYENRIIVRHENSDPLSIADMSVWDSSDDGDIPFTAVDASPDTLTLPADRKLVVWANKEFEPNGNVTLSGGGAGAAYDGTLELYANATFDSTGTESHTIGGSFLTGAGSVFDEDSSTFTFTTTGSARTIDTNEYPFYNVVFNGSGSWTVANTAFSVGNDLTISQGAVTLPSGTTTVTGSLSVTSGSFNANGGTMLFNSAGVENIAAGNSIFNALTINGSGSFTLQGTNATATADVYINNGTFASVNGTFAIGGDFINDGTFAHNTGTLRLTSTTTALVVASSSDLYSTVFTGGGAYTFPDEDLALLGSLTIQSGSVQLPLGTMSIGGSLLNTGGSFTHATGSILFNSSDTGESVNPGNSTFSRVTFGSAGGGWTITGNATTTSDFSLVSANTFVLSSSTRLYVGGVFTNTVGGGATTWTGSTLVINSGTGYTINTKTTGGDVYNNVLIGSSTALRAWDSTGSITLEDSDSSFYSQDHAGVPGSLYIYGDYVRDTGADYWSYATDFDGVALGGSSRQVFVSHAQGASTTITGGSLNIVGANGFDTTISNQGSGTYGMNILGGTFNAQYYSLANMGAPGLVLSGLTTVTSLTEGNFTLAVGGGSLITLASTTLNYNAGLVVTGTSFATTTAITGYNINLVGSTPSAWTLSGHSGNFDGENFDNDGGDACGSLRWDDSSCLLTEQSAYRFRYDDGGEGVPNSEWYDLDWTKRKRVTVTNADAVSYANVAVEVTIPYDSDMQADFDDLRFTRSDGTTLISHFRETYTASTEATVWVEVPLLATSTDTEIYMYYGNGGETDGSATSTFIFIDNFEDGNITEYSGDTGEFVTNNTSAYERTYKLIASDPATGKTDFGGMYNNSYAVAQGQTLRYLQYIDATETGDETCTTFATQSQTQNYGVCLELFGVDRMSLAQDVLHRDTSGTVLASTTVSYSTGWYEVEIDWRTNNSIFVSLYQDDVLVATTSATDNSYTSGGVGYTLWTNHGAWDMYTSRVLTTTEPTTTIGYEQVSGGASWVSAENAPGTGIETGENVRVRFLVENTGLSITAQNFELEYAPKGAAPSCEAVDYGDYVEVPASASCGLSEICMATSSNIANLESTTDLLGGDGIFTPGQVVEDPSNNTGNLDVDANEFTELEYVIETTENVADSVYCLRVTNEGADLDSYSRIAELQLIFIPNITSLTLNGGLDITLTGGATTTVTATGTVSDLNGYTDLDGATTTIFRSGVGESCSADNNNCYIAGNGQCSFVNCSGTSCDVECSADVYYHADPTDIGTFAGETWRALLSVSDLGGDVATATAPSIDLLTLRAIEVDSTIDYGTLAVNADTGSYNATTTIENIGNDALDVAIEGTDLTDGGSSLIPVSEQIFATSTFTYSSCVFCSSLATTSTNLELSLNKPASTTPAVTDEVYWGIAVPFGVAGTPHTGTNIFYAIGD